MAHPSVIVTSPSAMSARRLVESVLRFKSEGVTITSYYTEWSEPHMAHVFYTQLTGPYEAVAATVEHYTRIEKFARSAKIQLVDRAD